MSPDREAELERRHTPTLWMDRGSGKHYRQVLPVGSWERDGCRHYAKWQPVKPFLKVFWVGFDKPFWLEPWSTLERDSPTEKVDRWLGRFVVVAGIVLIGMLIYGLVKWNSH